ncbi:MAG TPA: DUF2809 domain-containing protein [Hymenobacter sp.]|jgi:hypothetical protein|uniref:ribosomal maturation YjgA family protein n=1 Tax=Hymenobacter sp. TaxID=1898978 RepID=UPI002ED77548
MLTFRKGYFLVALGLFAVESIIAVFVHDQVVRPYIGDVLAAIFLYTLLRSFVALPAFALAMVALAGTYLIEALQFVRLLHYLGLQDVAWARTVLGSTFSGWDLLTYTVGIGLVLAAERRRPDFYALSASTRLRARA